MVSANASIKILFVKIKVSMGFTLGYVELPKVVHLAGEGAGGKEQIWSRNNEATATAGDGSLSLRG